jgi:hypothetical protein
MNSDELRNRTKTFAVRIIKLVVALPRNRAGDVLGRQILKSGTSVGANYREALRASSRRHFVTTLEIAIRFRRGDLVLVGTPRRIRNHQAFPII